jgi:hypothetical protein
MKTKAKTFHIIVWSMLTLAGFNPLAAKEPLYDGLGSYSRKVTTDSAEAQRYFDQGLGFLHGFNHRANGWSLLGLAESLRKQKENADEVAQTQAKFKKVWAKADLTITTSCLCQPLA